MSAVGPNSAPITSAARDLTTQGQNVTVGAADIAISSVFNCGYCRRIWCNESGTLFLQREKDSAPASYTVTAGAVIDGKFTLIGGTTNHAGASAITLVLEA